MRGFCVQAHSAFQSGPLFTILLASFLGIVDVVQGQTDPPVFDLQWGGFGSGPGQFNSPVAIAISASGNVYVTDNDNHRIQRFSTTGDYLGSWGLLGSEPGEFNWPSAIAVADGPVDTVYVVDEDNHRVQKFVGNGTFLTQWGSYGTGNGQFITPPGHRHRRSGLRVRHRLALDPCSEVHG